MTVLFTLAAVAAGVTGALVVVWASGREWTGGWDTRWSGRDDMSRSYGSGVRTTLRGLAAALVVGGLAAFPLGVVGMRYFGIIHLAYLGVTIAVPLVGAALAVRSLRGPLPRVWALAGVTLVLPAPVGWYATHVEPYRLAVDRKTVPVAADRAGDDTVLVGVLADLQTDRVSSHEHDAVDRLLAAEPDLILVAGRRAGVRSADDPVGGSPRCGPGRPPRDGRQPPLRVDRSGHGTAPGAAGPPVQPTVGGCP
jgi:hypothetical protein